MNILFLTSRLPYPPNRGDKLRVFNFISRLSKNHSIILLSFIESEKQMSYVKELEKYCNRVVVVLLRPWQSYLNCLLGIFSSRPLQVSYYNSKSMKARIKNIIENGDIEAVYVHLFRMTAYAKYIRGAKRVLDLCDAVSMHMKRTIQFNRGILWPVYLLEWLRIKNYEKMITKDFDEIVFISETDKQAVINKCIKNTHFNVIPNGVDYDYFKPVLINNHDIPRVAFLGYLKTFYNLDAILYFYKKIFPIIKSNIPEVKFLIIGANCPSRLRKLARDKSVELICDVDDTRPYLGKAKVFVCPLRVGSGLQNKILEAMSMGLPVVTTSIGYAGVTAVKNKEIFVEDQPEAFSRKVIELINNEQIRNKVSFSSRKSIEDNYLWEKSISKLEELLK